MERCEWFLDHFGETKHGRRVRETRDLLRQMVAEDRRHVADPDDRVADLIFQLRNQNGRQWCQPGACDIFNDPRKDKSPAHQLVKLGHDAVPQLIEAMDDRRFTRSVGYHRDFRFSHHVLRVGDCAVSILERIAGRGFYRRSHTNAAMIKYGGESRTGKEIRAWWSEVREKGSRQVLIDGVTCGDDNAPSQAALLLDRHPEDAFAAIAEGVGNAENEWVRTSLIQLAAATEAPAVVDFLERQMNDAGNLQERVAAARRTAPAPTRKGDRRDDRGVEETPGLHRPRRLGTHDPGPDRVPRRLRGPERHRGTRMPSRPPLGGPTL